MYNEARLHKAESSCKSNKPATENVVKGSFDMEYRDKTVTIHENEFIIVPRGVEHRPVAKEEVSVMLFEPATTLNTGNVNNELTKMTLEKI